MIYYVNYKRQPEGLPFFLSKHADKTGLFVVSW